MVVVMTDGRATDGQCKEDYTCDEDTLRCNNPGPGKPKECRLVYSAPKLKALEDRNQTVTVISVGFGVVDEEELKFIASEDDNVVMAQAADAASGLASLKKLLNNIFLC